MKLKTQLVTLVLAMAGVSLSLKAANQSAAIPSTDITVLSIDTSQQPAVVDQSRVIKVITYDGYDNQPSFSRDGKTLFFTRMLGEQTDILGYRFKSDDFINLSQSDDISEYSPTVYNDNSISVIGVNDLGQQHLRLLDFRTGKQQVLNPQIEPVGYHAWLNPDVAAVFVLGEVMTLQLLELNTQNPGKPLVENIGRSFHRLSPNQVSFSQVIDGLHHIMIVNEKGEIEPTGIVLPKGVQDYTWLDSEGVLFGDGSQLWYISNTNKKKIADLKGISVNNITRLALDNKRQRIAIVHE